MENSQGNARKLWLLMKIIKPSTVPKKTVLRPRLTNKSLDLRDALARPSPLTAAPKRWDIEVVVACFVFQDYPTQARDHPGLVQRWESEC